jgi:UDP-N-acetylmuramate--alanine ligase
MIIDFSQVSGHIHFIGIDGISMSALATIMQKRGWRVSGSDVKISPLTQKLIDGGATFYLGQSAANISDPDIVVYTAAVKPDNPELMQAREKGLQILTRAQFLGSLMQESGCGIAISGAHGKTTTTALIGLMLEEGGCDPTVLIGGELDALGGNVKVGARDYFVAEACEYYETFLSLKPQIGVILNIDADHLDYFGGMHHIKSAFRRFAELIPVDGTLVACTDDEHVRDIISGLACQLVTYGLNGTADWSATGITATPGGGSSFEVLYRGKSMGLVQLSVPGRHNIQNALASLAVGATLDIPWSAMSRTLGIFQGTHRRFEFKGTYNDAVVIDDYAHHPTEIVATLGAAAERKPHRIIVVFQSHTYTRTSALLADFAAAFGDADIVIITDIYAAREQNVSGVTGESLAQAISRYHPHVIYKASLNDATDLLRETLMPGDMIITMGAGDVHIVGEQLLGQHK